jgi:hypothetical protein
MLALSAVDCVSGQTKDYEIGIKFAASLRATLRSKRKTGWNQQNVCECSDMSTKTVVSVS